MTFFPFGTGTSGAIRREYDTPQIRVTQAYLFGIHWHERVNLACARHLRRAIRKVEIACAKRPGAVDATRSTPYNASGIPKTLRTTVSVPCYLRMEAPHVRA